MTSLPPLSNASCVKCGAAPNTIALRYVSTPAPYGSLLYYTDHTEALERRCTVCNFSWLEAPKNVGT